MKESFGLEMTGVACVLQAILLPFCLVDSEAVNSEKRKPITLKQGSLDCVTCL